LQPSIIAGKPATLEWDVTAPATLTIDQGIGDVMNVTVDGIGYLEVSPASDTTYTLALNGGATATTSVRVFPDRTTWNDTHFTPGEQSNPEIFGGDKDPDGDGYTNDEEFQFQTDPRSGSSSPKLEGRINGSGSDLQIEFSSPYPLMPVSSQMLVETSDDLSTWIPVSANTGVFQNGPLEN